LLQRAGHRAIGPDLHFDDPTRGARDAARQVVDALADDGDDVVVVGHSFGGMVVPLVAAARPVRRMVFLGAMVPMPGMSYVDYLATAEGAGAITMPRDRVGRDDLGRTVARERLAADLVELPGSHSPFYSRPAELAEILGRL